MLTLNRLLPPSLLAFTVLAVWGMGDPGSPEPPPARVACRTVFLAGAMPEEALVRLGAAVASRPGAMLLLDSATLAPYLRHFLRGWKPDGVVAVGGFPEKDAASLSRRLGAEVKSLVPCANAEGACPAWKQVLVRADTVVVCPARPRPQLLQAACLAGALKAPLWVVKGPAEGPDAARRFVRETGAKRVVVAGDLPLFRGAFAGAKVTRLRQPRQVEQAYLRQLGSGGPVQTAVVANPADTAGGKGGMSLLAPWLAAGKRAALLLTNEAGTNSGPLVERAVRSPALGKVESLIYLANLKAVPTVQRPNPIPEDKDKVIDMEPVTPSGPHPHSFAVGRLFHADRAAVPLMLARQRLLVEQTGPRRVLVASNPGGGLSLLETFSRNTVHELRNGGYHVDALFGRELTAKTLRRGMPDHDIFLWEGHHNTLVKEWGFTEWDEPLAPTFVFLQSCLALQDFKVQPLLSRGAFGVLGTSTRTYSGSGGAFSLSFFNALLYEGRSLGAAVRQSKNFLLAYARLKEKRLGTGAARTGANLRAAWAFTLWGDPTFEMPLPRPPEKARPGVKHAVNGKSIVIEVPAGRHEKVVTDRYVVRMPPNARLAGLLRKAKDEDGQPLVPFVFAEVKMPQAGTGVPRVRTKLRSRNWVFLWDGRRKTGYVLATPPADQRAELRFRVEWPGTSVASETREE